jgi:hypothetical protein
MGACDFTTPTTHLTSVKSRRALKSGGFQGKTRFTQIKPNLLIAYSIASPVLFNGHDEFLSTSTVFHLTIFYPYFIPLLTLRI